MLGDEKAVVVIMENFKGQVTEKMLKLLDEHFIYPCLLPPNTTDHLQPMDVSVNKPAKAFVRKQFQLWYCGEISSQLGGDELLKIKILVLLT